MCNFISWIERDGELYYLTDEEIFSSFGREMLDGCQDNDFIGHGAIRRYFQLAGEGTDHEVRKFWNAAALPKELSRKIKNFDKYWGKTFHRYFTNGDLRYIIAVAPEKWGEKAQKIYNRSSCKSQEKKESL